MDENECGGQTGRSRREVSATLANAASLFLSAHISTHTHSTRIVRAVISVFHSYTHLSAGSAIATIYVCM